MLFPVCDLALLAPLSSHREAPAITQMPKVDGTDFYMFRATEPGHEGNVVFVADYIPLQDPYGGPNYFTLDPNALYEILIDNNGDAKEDITFQFRFTNNNADIALAIGPVGNQKTVSIPLIAAGGIGAGDTANLNVSESYTLKVVFGDKRTGLVNTVTDSANGATTFAKPLDNVGTKTIADYDAYAATHVRGISLPGGFTGRVFVGQRDDPFVVNLGEVFDLVNLNPLGATNAKTDIIADANITSMILEIPIAFLVAGDPTIGAWTTASLRQARVLNPSPTPGVPDVQGGAWTQVSRLSAPLVNELVIGLKDKDRFNASEPFNDAQFADYVTYPTLPALLQALFPAVTAPTLFPRADLVQVFLTGVPGLNVNGSVAEMLRLNTNIAPTPKGMQNNLGVIGGDLAGFPNGRRLGDDVVDIALRAVMGALLPLADAPSGQLAFTDGAYVDDSAFDVAFPYVRTPLPGSPNNE